MATQISDYIPKTLSRWEQRLFTLFSTGQISRPAELGFCRGRMDLGFAPDRVVPRGRDADLVLSWSDRCLGIILNGDRGLGTLLGAGNAESPLFGIDIQALPEPVAMAMAEAVFSKDLAHLSALVGEPIEFIEPGEAPDFFSDPHTLCVVDFSFTTDSGEQVTGLAALPPDAALFRALEDDLSAFKPETPPLPGLDGIGITAAFALGQIHIPVRDLKQLEPGDILIPDQWFPDQNQGRLIIPPLSYRFSFDTEGTPGKGPTHITLLEKGVRRVDGHIKKTDDTIEDLEVNITFEVERRTMTLAQVRKLAAGTLIPLGLSPETGVMVDIVAGGKCLTRGRVVSLGESLGIQVLGVPAAMPEKETVEGETPLEELAAPPDREPVEE